jgi:succinate dehydrogenase / fumarate reductase cytochrome b subunit
MARRSTFVSSSVGTKVILAASGLALFGYLVLHLAGNLLIYFGPAALNGWGHRLVSNPLVVPAEIALLLIFVVHVWKAVANWWANRQARPVPYAMKRWAGHTSRKNLGSTTMIWSGAVVLVFVVLHVAGFKYGLFYEPPPFEPGVRDLYQLVVGTFRHPGWAAFYVVAMVFVGLHLRHGISSACQSLGLDGPRFTPAVLRAGVLLAVAIGAGFASIPLWAYFFR